MFTMRHAIPIALVLVLPAATARAGEPDMLPLPHRAAVVSCAFSPDGKQVATASDKAVRLWDLSTGREAKQIPLTDKVAHVVFSPDGRTLITAPAEKGGAFQMVEAATGKLLWKLQAARSAVTSMALTPDGKRLTYGSDDGTLSGIDAASGKVTMLMRGHRGAVTSVAVSPDGRQFASGSADNSVQIWEFTGRALMRMQGHNKAVDCVAFSPDGKLLASGGQDKVVRLWDTNTGKEVRQLEAQDAVRCVAFSPDGKLVAVACGDKPVRLFEAATGKESRQFGGLQGKLNGLAFSPDGARIVTAGQDGTAIVWDLKHDEKPLAKDLKLSAKALAGLWDDLGGDDARKAYSALRTLRAAPADSLPFLRERLKPKPAGTDAKKIAALIRDLDSDDFDTREKATKELQDLGRPAEPAVREALAGTPSAEAKVRLGRVLEKIGGEGTMTPEQQRDLRAVRAIEGIGTPEARKLLESLVGESPGWWVTQEAKAALARLGEGK
jgi:DNA-binding beta-propeller fold protein YncE